jgi:cutinase-like protein
LANHVAAVTLFCPLYQPKTLELCASGDPVCSEGGVWVAHAACADDGMVDQAANYAVSRL